MRRLVATAILAYLYLLLKRTEVAELRAQVQEREVQEAAWDT